MRNNFFKCIFWSTCVSLKYSTEVLLSLRLNFFLSQIDVFLLWIWSCLGCYLIFSSCLGQLKELGCEILAQIFFWSKPVLRANVPLRDGNSLPIWDKTNNVLPLLWNLNGTSSRNPPNLANQIRITWSPFQKFQNSWKHSAQNYSFRNI